MYGIYYLMFTTFPGGFADLLPMCISLTSCADLFGNVYGFSPGIAGLCYIGLGIGFFSATFFGASYADKMYSHVSGGCLRHYMLFRSRYS